MKILSEYTGGNAGWGTMICRCADCGEIVAEYDCDDCGNTVAIIFDNVDQHECEGGQEE